jgi:hypothetical protein
MATKKKNGGSGSVNAIDAFMASREEVVQQKKGKDDDTGCVDVGDDDFESFVALSYVFDAIKAHKEQKADEFKVSLAGERMFQQVCEKQKPTTFNAVQGKAKCQFVYSKHTPLAPDAIFTLTQSTIGEVFKEHNIPHEEVGVPEQLVINPDILKDQEILSKVAKALMKIESELDGIQVVLKQKADVKLRITDDTLTGIAKVKDKEIRKALFDTCSTISVKSPNIESDSATSFQDAFAILNKAGIWKQIASEKQAEEAAKEAIKAAKKK